MIFMCKTSERCCGKVSIYKDWVSSIYIIHMTVLWVGMNPVTYLQQFAVIHAHHSRFLVNFMKSLLMFKAYSQQHVSHL